MADREVIVVGIDDSSASAAVLRWGIGEARARQLPLRVVCAYRWALPEPWAVHLQGVADPETTQHRRAATLVVEQAVAYVIATDPEVKVQGEAIDGDTVAVLLAESAQAAVLGLGSRRLGTLGSFLLGSVATAVSARAECPVVVLRGLVDEPTASPAVVVGVDGAQATRAVLAFAYEYASWHRLPLRPVLCWPGEPVVGANLRLGPTSPQRVQRWLSEELAGWADRYPDVEVHAEVLEHHPVHGLVAASAGQALLVVGTHGRHALAGTLLGSVSQGVLHHASCPVAVVPDHDAGR